MKIKFLFFLSLCVLSINAQNFFTTIPDSAFEAYLEANQMGNSILNDNSVLTANINTVDTLNVSNLNIFDLTGIENFSSLQHLNCSYNNIDTLKLNSNEYLKYLDCSSNELALLLIDSLNALDSLNCSFNNLSTLDVSALDLYILQCEHNPITNIDLTNNVSLKHLTCHDNFLQTINLNSNTNLEWLSIKNSDLLPPNNDISILDLSVNCNITNFYCNNNLNLYCIQVCDSVMAINNWIYNIDSQQYFLEDCNYTSMNESDKNSGKIISIKDIYGRESYLRKNVLLFYIYENGTIEKKIISQ